MIYQIATMLLLVIQKYIYQYVHNHTNILVLVHKKGVGGI